MLKRLKAEWVVAILAWVSFLVRIYHHIIFFYLLIRSRERNSCKIYLAKFLTLFSIGKPSQSCYRSDICSFYDAAKVKKCITTKLQLYPLNDFLFSKTTSYLHTNTPFFMLYWFLDSCHSHQSPCIWQLWQCKTTNFF